MTRTKDELFRHFSQATAPADSFAPTGATEPYNETFPAKVTRAVSEWQNAPRFSAVESTGPASNLPESVSAAEILAENEGRGDNMWPARDPASAPILSGTKVVATDGLGEVIAAPINAVAEVINAVNESSTGESEPQ